MVSRVRTVGDATLRDETTVDAAIAYLITNHITPDDDLQDWEIIYFNDQEFDADVPVTTTWAPPPSANFRTIIRTARASDFPTHAATKFGKISDHSENRTTSDALLPDNTKGVVFACSAATRCIDNTRGLTLQGLQIRYTPTFAILLDVADGEVTVQDCILRVTDSNSRCFYIGSNGNSVEFYNNVFFDRRELSNVSQVVLATTASMIVLGNTFVNTSASKTSSSVQFTGPGATTAEISGNVAIGYFSGFNIGGTFGTLTADGNAADAGASFGTNYQSVTSAAIESATHASPDARAASGSPLIGGVALASLSPLTDDIIGSTRADPATIGAFEFVTAGGTVTGTGDVSIPAITVSGTAEREITASGAITVAAATVSGAAEREITASGAISTAAITIAGTGAVGPVVTGSGAITIAAVTVSGTAEREITASGDVAIPAITVSGTAEREITASGAITVAATTVSGAAEREITASGALTFGAVTVSGVGSLGAIITGRTVYIGVSANLSDPTLTGPNIVAEEP